MIKIMLSLTFALLIFSCKKGASNEKPKFADIVIAEFKPAAGSEDWTAAKLKIIYSSNKKLLTTIEKQKNPGKSAEFNLRINYDTYLFQVSYLNSEGKELYTTCSGVSQTPYIISKPSYHFELKTCSTDLNSGNVISENLVIRKIKGDFVQCKNAATAVDSSRLTELTMNKISGSLSLKVTSFKSKDCLNTSPTVLTNINSRYEPVSSTADSFVVSISNNSFDGKPYPNISLFFKVLGEDLSWISTKLASGSEILTVEQISLLKKKVETPVPSPVLPPTADVRIFGKWTRCIVNSVPTPSNPSKSFQIRYEFNKESMTYVRSGFKYALADCALASGEVAGILFPAITGSYSVANTANDGFELLMKSSTGSNTMMIGSVIEGKMRVIKICSSYISPTSTGTCSISEEIYSLQN